MRILFTSHHALPHLGGIEFVVDALASRLAARGHDVTHIAAADGTESHPPYRVLRVRATTFVERKLDLPYPLHHPVDLFRTVRDEVRRADVVHAHGLLYQASVLALLTARHERCARVVTEHVGHVPYSNLLTNSAEALAIATIGRAAARAAQTIIVLNDNVRAQMRTLAPSVPIVEIGNGVDTAMFRPASVEERAALRAGLGWDSRPRVLFVGRLVEKKGVHLAVEAARRAGGEIQLVLLGPGEVSGDTPYVERLGALPPSRVAEIYRASDVFLLPSRGEGFPLSAQEAMASALPVILGEDPAYERLLAGSGDAVCLVRRDADAIVSAVRAVLRSDLVRRGQDALRFARSRFDWSVTIDRHVELYERVISDAKGRGR